MTIDGETQAEIKWCKRQILVSESKKQTWMIFIIGLAIIIFISALINMRSMLDFFLAFLGIPAATAVVIVIVRLLFHSEQKSRAREIYLMKNGFARIKQMQLVVTNKNAIVSKEDIQTEIQNVLIKKGSK